MLAGVLIAFALQSAPDAGPMRDEVETAIGAIHTAWAAGDLDAALAASTAGADLISGGPCAVSADAARLAYTAGLAGLHHPDPQPRLAYYFWAAGEIDEAAGGLTAVERQVAGRFGVEPGLRPALDHLYARSPYLTGDLQAAASCPDRFTRPEGPETDSQGRVSIVIDRGGGRPPRLDRHTLLEAYPAGAGRAFSEAIRAYGLTWSQRRGHERISSIASPPCPVFVGDDEAPVRVCADAAGATP